MVPEYEIGGVYEDVGISKLDRKERIINIQKHLGNVNWKMGYINAGVVIASRYHKEIFNTTIEEINNIQKTYNIITPEQDFFNYMIRKLGFKVFELNYKFNHIRYFPANRFDSYIIHYAGSQVFDNDLTIKRGEDNNKDLWRELTAQQMKRDYNKCLNTI